MNRLIGSLFIVFLCVGALAATDARLGGEDHPACEPAGELDVSAAVIAREDLGSRVRLHIDLKIHSWTAPNDSVRITGVIGAGTRAVEIPERELSLPAKSPRKLRYTLDLEKGGDHHLEFSVRSLTDPSRASSAYLRLNLDPRLEPEKLGDVIQYRAQMQGR